MLLDDEEFAIMASAAQPQLRDQQSDAKFRSLFEYFFAGRDFSGREVLELGPGQCDFSRFAAAAGASVTVMDHDPAVVALGRKRGYEAIIGDFLTFDWGTLRARFDGLFARNSISVQRFSDPASFEALIDGVCSVLKPSGWGWVVPWNRFRGTPSAEIGRMLESQRKALERNGFRIVELTSLIAGPEPGTRHQWELFLRDIDPGPLASEPKRLLGLV
ncbi:MAG TPA: class I SAM-dependent methyltransferase [Stellaceae bacterium]|jgi:hypothetical protein